MPKRKSKPEKRGRSVRLERRARVTFFLVSEVQEEVDAVIEIVIYFFNQYWFHLFGHEWELPVTGFTHSFIPDTVSKEAPRTMLGARKQDSIFIGHWWSENKVRIKGIEAPLIKQVAENVTLFVIDLPAVAEEWKFDESIVHLKEEIFLPTQGMADLKKKYG